LGAQAGGSQTTPPVNMSPAAILTERLADARRNGESYAQAWPDALSAALAPVPTNDERGEWADVLGSMVLTWRSAFERRPAASRPEAALAVLLEEDRVPLPDHPCEHCGEEIPAPRLKKQSAFCGETCRAAAALERQSDQREAVAV
jgi:hypothetical protein